jgi:hypothetical protein
MMQPATSATAGQAWLWAMLSLATLLAMPVDASASSRLCRQLEAQLADAGRGGGGSPSQVRRYDRAIDAQQTQLRKARRQARRANCGFFDFDRGNSSCSAISDQLDRMERNLRSLQGRRAELASGDGNPRRNRARILAALDANGCRSVPEIEQPREQYARRDNRNFFERLFSGPRPSYDEEEAPPISERERVRTVIGGYENDYGGSYRTLCVRTCDGYYWPISYSSSRGEFQRDEQNCQTMCPGTEVRLFTHRVPEQESEQMVDLSGVPYADMSTAFKYREANFERPQDCTCRAAPKNFSVIAGNGSSGIQDDAPNPVALPQRRPDPAADPETEANRNGSLDQQVVKRLIESNPSTVAADRKVRVVGRAYLPDPPKAEAQPVQGRTAIQ